MCCWGGAEYLLKPMNVLSHRACWIHHTDCGTCGTRLRPQARWIERSIERSIEYSLQPWTMERALEVGRGSQGANEKRLEAHSFAEPLRTAAVNKLQKATQQRPNTC